MLPLLGLAVLAMAALMRRRHLGDTSAELHEQLRVADLHCREDGAVHLELVSLVVDEYYLLPTASSNG